MRPLIKLWAVVLLGLSGSPCAGTSVSASHDDWARLRATLRDRSISPEWRDKSGNSAAYLHLVFGSEAYAVELIRRARLRGPWLENESRLLNTAIVLGSQRAVEALLRRPESPQALSPNGISPLMLAAYNDKLEIMRMLLHAKADLSHRTTEGETAMSSALRNGSWRAAYLLVDHGFPLARSKKRKFEDSLMFAAVEGGEPHAIALLADHGLNVNVRNQDNETPLAYAIRNMADSRIIDALLAEGATPCKMTRDGQSAEMLVSRLVAEGKTAAMQYQNSFAPCK